MIASPQWPDCAHVGLDHEELTLRAGMRCPLPPLRENATRGQVDLVVGDILAVHLAELPRASSK
jgi:hypothetical protein